MDRQSPLGPAEHGQPGCWLTVAVGTRLHPPHSATLFPREREYVSRSFWRVWGCFLRGSLESACLSVVHERANVPSPAVMLWNVPSAGWTWTPRRKRWCCPHPPVPLRIGDKQRINEGGFRHIHHPHLCAGNGRWQATFLIPLLSSWPGIWRGQRRHRWLLAGQHRQQRPDWCVSLNWQLDILPHISLFWFFSFCLYLSQQWQTPSRPTTFTFSGSESP